MWLSEFRLKACIYCRHKWNWKDFPFSVNTWKRCFNKIKKNVMRWFNSSQCCPWEYKHCFTTAMFSLSLSVWFFLPPLKPRGHQTHLYNQSVINIILFSGTDMTSVSIWIQGGGGQIWIRSLRTDVNTGPQINMKGQSSSSFYRAIRYSGTSNDTDWKKKRDR